MIVEELESRLAPALIVPELNSLPGAFQTLYLDFDGSTPFLWDGAKTGTPYVVRGPSPDDAPIPVPAFTTDADANNFSNAELTYIRDIHAWVAEKFSPFSINVTTVDPGVVEDSRNITCLIGGSSSDWLGRSAGGVASLGGFYDGGEKTCFAFSAGVSSATIERFIGETIAHEAGHVIGLGHQRQLQGFSPIFNLPIIDEYYDGNSLVAPIMGGSSNNTTARGIWWITNLQPQQNSPDFIQDDLSVLTNGQVGLSYRTDDYNTNSPSNAPIMVFNGAGVLTQLKGIIEQQFDVDDFRFHATGTRATFQIKNAPFGGMLAATASIRISGTNTQIPVNLTLTYTGANIEATNLIPGTDYVLRVAGQGQYGDIGQYTIDGSIQQFATFDAASGTVSIGGFVGNNNVTLSTRNNTLIVEDSVNGGRKVRQTFSLNAVNRVVVFLGGGDDTLNVGSLVHADLSTIEVISNLGGGFDILRLGDTGNSFSTFNIGQFAFAWTPVNAGTSRVRDSGSERVELIGTNSIDVFNIHSQPFYSTMYVFGNGGNDRLYIGPEVVASDRPPVIFDGGQGTDTLEMDGSILTDPQQFVVFNNRVQRFLPGFIVAAETHFGTAVETLRIRGGSGDDSFKVLELRAGMSAFLSGSAGADEFRVGDSSNPVLALPFSANVRGIVNVTAGSGSDRLVVDDAAWSSVGNYTIDGSGVKNTFVNNWVQYDSTLDRVDFHSRSGGTTQLTTPLTSQEFHLFNGPGNGIGTLIVDDRSGLSGPVSIALHPDRIVRNFTLGISRQIHYSGYESLTLYSSDGTNAINVFGTSPDITQQTTIVTGARNDVVTLYPHGADGASAATIVTPLGYFGGAGADTFRVDDTASSLHIDYLFNNAGGATTANIFGLGQAAVGAFKDVETIDVLAGSGNDTFTFDSFKSGAALLISGGQGVDRLLIADQDTNTRRRYDLDVDPMVGQESNGALTTRRLNSANIEQSVRFDHVESVTLDGGSGGNLFKIAGTPAAASVIIHAGAGDDTIDVGSSNPSFGEVNSLRDIRGPLTIDGQDGNDGVILRDDGDPNDRNYTLSPTMLVRSDAPVSPISYANVQTLALKGSGGDNVFMLTSSTFVPAISIDGGGGVNTLDYSAIGNIPGISEVPDIPNIVSWYQGEGSATDSVGGNHGTIHGDVAFVPGKVGRAFAFDGVEDYIDLGSDPSLDLPGSMSVSLWVRLDTLDNPKYFLADFLPNTGNTSQGSLGTVADGTTFAWVQSYTDGTVETLASATTIQLNTWFHLAAVRDDSAKSVRLFVNGIEDASLSYAGKTVVSLQGSKILGGSGPAFPGDFIDGLLDEVGIYNRALGDAEIRSLFAAGNIGEPGDGVVVNLALGTSSGLSGGIANIQNVTGSAGNDILVGNGGNVLNGGAGRDILIAGAFASVLLGGDGDDLLIAGTTVYDNDPDGLDKLRAQWTSNNDYATRVALLRGDLLSDGKFTPNGGPNTLLGQAGRDLFFASLDDFGDWEDDEITFLA